MWEQLWKKWLRICCICKDIKPLDNEHFFRCKSSWYWYDYKCRICSRIKNKERWYNRKTKDTYKWYVYIIKCEDNYKIGITKHDDIKKRIDNMQCGNPYILTLHKMYYSDDMFKSENKLHKYFKKKLIRWERYKLDFDDLIYINIYFI